MCLSNVFIGYGILHSTKCIYLQKVCGYKQPKSKLSSKVYFSGNLKKSQNMTFLYFLTTFLIIQKVLTLYLFFK